MHLKIVHRTFYSYSNPVKDSHNEVRLQPLTDDSQVCGSFKLTVEPPVTVRSYNEPGGTVHFFNFRRAHSSLSIVAEAEVETFAPLEVAELEDRGWDFYDREETRQGFAEYLVPTRIVPILPSAVEIGDEVFTSSDEPSRFLERLNHSLGEMLTYSPGATHVHTTLEEFAETREGVCQDFAHFMLAICRSRRIPCRYVSGYLYAQDDPLAHQDPGATHAWIECLLPDGRWRSYDPTNPDKPLDHYVRAHFGRDYGDVVPVRGIYRGGGAESMCVEVRVEAIGGRP